jgi:hypothetical protein
MIWKFKQKYGENNWYKYFREFVQRLLCEKYGPPMGSLEDIMEHVRR